MKQFHSLNIGRGQFSSYALKGISGLLQRADNESGNLPSVPERGQHGSSSVVMVTPSSAADPQVPGGQLTKADSHWFL